MRPVFSDIGDLVPCAHVLASTFSVSRPSLSVKFYVNDVCHGPTTIKGVFVPTNVSFFPPARLPHRFASAPGHPPPLFAKTLLPSENLYQGP